MVTAKEARETATLAQQKKATTERKQELDRQAEVTQKVDDLIEKQIVKMDKLIKKAIRKGEMWESYTADDNEIEQRLIGRMAAYYTKDGYQVRRESYTVDHGDSAAPCVVNMLRLTVNW